MDSITLLYTRRRRNPVSWLIRWAVPRSRFALALSSHCMIDAGDTVIEANMIYGVREVDRSVGLAGLTVVNSIAYAVPDRAAGLAWARSQICTYVPPSWAPAWLAVLFHLFNSNYDWRGAFGLGLTPYRDWAEDTLWYCYEFGAGTLRAAGRRLFANLNHIGEVALMAIDPSGA